MDEKKKAEPVQHTERQRRAMAFAHACTIALHHAQRHGCVEMPEDACDEIADALDEMTSGPRVVAVLDAHRST